MLRTAIVVALAACAAACAAGPKPDPALTRGAGLTPTQNYKIAVTQSPDEIQLAVHADGLSDRQGEALEALVSRWQDTGGHAVTVKAPAGGGREAARMVMAVQDRLERLGVASGLIRIVASDQPADARPIVNVSFASYHAEGPKCGRDWQDFTKTAENQVNSNFGCAVTANIAAMVANPADLADPHQSADADANRREVALGLYRQGKKTSTDRDPQAVFDASDVVN